MLSFCLVLPNLTLQFKPQSHAWWHMKVCSVKNELLGKNIVLYRVIFLSCWIKNCSCGQKINSRRLCEAGNESPMPDVFF